MHRENSHDRGSLIGESDDAAEQVDDSLRIPPDGDPYSIRAFPYTPTRDLSRTIGKNYISIEN